MDALPINTRSVTIGGLNKFQAVVLLRWVLIIATSYLVLFSRPNQEIPVSAALFVAAYLASNVVLTSLMPRIRSEKLFDTGVVLLDTVAVSVGLVLTDSASSDFFLLYFVVIFLGALTERLGLVVGAAVMISATHLYTVSRYVGFDHLITDGYVLRVPFLLVVALFFGHLVENARGKQRDAEAAREREKMRTEFVSAVTHDLKNPLGLVQTLAEHLLEGYAGPLAEKQEDLVRRIHANARHVINISLNLLDAARIEAGRLHLQRTPARLSDVVEDSIALQKSAGDLKGVRIHASFEPTVPKQKLDVMQMERVISNLLDNAIKYTATGGVVLVRVGARADAVVLTIFNEGEGIPQVELERIFDKYQRRDASGHVSGSGLGLFIVRRIVEAHGGTVEVDSIAGQGTTMTVVLPTSDFESRISDLRNKSPDSQVQSSKSAHPIRSEDSPRRFEIQNSEFEIP